MIEWLVPVVVASLGATCLGYGLLLQRKENKNKEKEIIPQDYVIKSVALQISDIKNRASFERPLIYWVEALLEIRKESNRWIGEKEMCFFTTYEDYDVKIRKNTNDTEVSFLKDNTMIYRFSLTNNNDKVVCNWKSFKEVEDYEAVLLSELIQIRNKLNEKIVDFRKNEWIRKVKENGINEKELEVLLIQLSEPKKYFVKTSKGDSSLLTFDTRVGKTTAQVIETQYVRSLSIKDRGERIAYIVYFKENGKFKKRSPSSKTRYVQYQQNEKYDEKIEEVAKKVLSNSWKDKNINEPLENIIQSVKENLLGIGEMKKEKEEVNPKVVFENEEEIIIKKITMLNELIVALKKDEELLDEEDVFYLKNTFEKDFQKISEQYFTLDEEQKNEVKDMLIGAIDDILEKVLSIQQRIQHNKKIEFRKQALIIKER